MHQISMCYKETILPFSPNYFGFPVECCSLSKYNLSLCIYNSRKLNTWISNLWTPPRNTLYWFKYILLISSSLPCYIALSHTDVLTVSYNTAKPEPSENSIGRALKGVSSPHILDLNQDQEYLNHSEMHD